MDRSHGKIVIEDLSELHSHEGVSVVQVGDVGVDHGGDGTGRWERCSGHGADSGAGYTWNGKTYLLMSIQHAEVY